MPRPITNPPARLRQRQRSDGSWRIWWEPETAIRALGFKPVALDQQRLTWSTREAERLNADVKLVRGKEASDRGPKRASAHNGRTIKDLINAYRASPHWDNLKPATQKDYRAAFNLIEGKWGASQVIDFDKPIMLEWYETLYRTSGKYQAASLLRKMSILFTYSEQKGWRFDNPCLRMKLVIPKSRDRIASWPEIDALLKECVGTPSMGCAIALAIFQGQRQKDIIEAKLADFTGGDWLFVRSKRSNHGALNIHPEVLPWMRQMLALDPDRETLLISEVTGRAYTTDHFQRIFYRIRKNAAKRLPTITTLQFRDLRRTFGHMARMGGASERDVADALGNNAWKDPKLSGTYMPANADTASRAVNAIARPDNHEPKKGNEK